VRDRVRTEVSRPAWRRRSRDVDGRQQAAGCLRCGRNCVLPRTFSSVVLRWVVMPPPDYDPAELAGYRGPPGTLGDPCLRIVDAGYRRLVVEGRFGPDLCAGSCVTDGVPVRGRWAVVRQRGNPAHAMACGFQDPQAGAPDAGTYATTSETPTATSVPRAPSAHGPGQRQISLGKII
jgi:hypothetical protein